MNAANERWPQCPQRWATTRARARVRSWTLARHQDAGPGLQLQRLRLVFLVAIGMMGLFGPCVNASA